MKTDPVVLAEWLAGRHAGMVFVADDLAAWLVGVVAEAGRKKLTSLVLGDEQKRALRPAATEAVRLTAAELCPGDGKRAEELAIMIGPLFKTPVPGAPLGEQATVLEALQAAIAGQLALLDDPGLTATVKSLTGMGDVSATIVAQKLTGHLLREIMARGSRGGPLEPLANQLNHDRTYLQDQRIDDKLLEILTLLGRTRAVAVAPTALAQLPAVTAGFTGRDGELAVLAGLLDPAGAAGPVLVSAVAGLAGVGKTTLAVEAGHAAQRQGWFGGGVLFLDLHGYDEVPVEASQALDGLLRALGVPAEQIPPGVEERAGLYRSMLAQITDPVLVIADNASAEAQVRPLLPGTGPHKMLVTSRHTLAGLGARLIDLTVLGEQAAVELLDRAVRAARPDDGRITGDPDAAARLARICGGLPLALQIAAALLKADATLGAGELAGKLAAEQDRLEELAYDDGSGLSVAAAFELSYRRLQDIQARVFRLLPVNPGPDVSTTAVAVLTHLPVSQARKILADLARAHLIDTAPGALSRWRMHDLLRLYAQRLSAAHADTDGREDARDRLLRYYLSIAIAADDDWRAPPQMSGPGQFADRDDALAWLDAERASLVAAVQMAADTGRDHTALRLPLILADYLTWRRRLDDWLAITSIGVEAARRLGDRRNEAAALTTLGHVLASLRRFDEAVSALQEALAIFRETGDRHGEGMALDNLGLALREVASYGEAVTAHQEAAAIFRETGDRHGEGMALDNLGIGLQDVGRYREAVTAHQEALAIFRETGDRHGEGVALNILASTLLKAGQRAEAVTVWQDAVAIFRETGDRHGEGMALNNFGLALREVRRFEEAITACQNAAAIFRETGDRHREDMALEDLERARAAQLA